KLRTRDGHLEEQWTAISSWKPAPDTGSGWEPVFHPALSQDYLYTPGAAGSVLKFDRRTGDLAERLEPFATDDANRYVISPLTLDGNGSIYYTVLKLDAAAPWGKDAREGWLVRIDEAGRSTLASFYQLAAGAPVEGCATSFSLLDLPWPPSP